MTLFIVQAAGTDDSALERARFIKDGFSWPALFFGWPWLVYQRLWLALAVWAVLEIGFIFLILPHVTVVAATAVELLARLFIGVEGNRLRQAKGARRAALNEVIEARDRDEAEAIFFRRHAGGTVA